MTIYEIFIPRKLEFIWYLFWQLHQPYDMVVSIPGWHHSPSPIDLALWVIQQYAQCYVLLNYFGTNKVCNDVLILTVVPTSWRSGGHYLFTQFSLPYCINSCHIDGIWGVEWQRCDCHCCHIWSVSHQWWAPPTPPHCVPLQRYSSSVVWGRPCYVDAATCSVGWFHFSGWGWSYMDMRGGVGLVTAPHLQGELPLSFLRHCSHPHTVGGCLPSWH